MVVLLSSEEIMFTSCDVLFCCLEFGIILFLKILNLFLKKDINFCMGLVELSCIVDR
jgi:hypothetical protein